MELIRDAAALRRRMDDLRAGGGTVALVPTMGDLHGGHRSLISRARREHPVVSVSIFVNPRQFGDAADFEAYPRDESRDLAACEELGVDVVWAPHVDEVFPPGLELPSPDPGPAGGTYEGAARPGHFEGVLTVVHRLFDVFGPCAAYFGEKDAQQLFLVQRMVDLERLPVEVVACPTVRESDGLAMSSRNARLSPDEREQAGCLFLALSEAAELARSGERDTNVLVAAMAREVGATPLARLDYAAVIDDRTFTPAARLEPEMPARALVAARFPSARLIDNLRLSARDRVGDDGRWLRPEP
ncbi:MAG TPA: pantoate--beta-alanine ligase [Actinomycetota bacterium]|jgi:pantoate--beta-alanine ligase|nr:pantoate--beta-alanine ligase [Actinomycetota bacterium]